MTFMPKRRRSDPSEYREFLKQLQESDPKTRVTVLMHKLPLEDAKRLSELAARAAGGWRTRRRRHLLARYMAKCFSSGAASAGHFPLLVEMTRVIDAALQGLSEVRDTPADKEMRSKLGIDELRGYSELLQIASELVRTSADLLSGRHPYSGSALLRQLVEVDYLAWAFAAGDRDAELWLRSDKAEREELFQPRNIRKRAKGRFQARDYGYHCDLGGHPVPGTVNYFKSSRTAPQLMLVDLLHHCRSIWRSTELWCDKTPRAADLKELSDKALARLERWLNSDPLYSNAVLRGYEDN